jgi:hypothetical protein
MQTMPWRKRWIAGLAALCSLAIAQQPTTVDTVEQFLSLPALGPVREAKRVEAVAVEMVGAGLSSTHRLVGRPVLLDTKTRHAVSSTVSSGSSYVGGSMACLFQPGVAFRFHNGRDSIQALVCFLCDELLFEDAGGKRLGDKLTISEDGRARLLEVAVKTFPDRGFENFRR